MVSSIRFYFEGNWSSWNKRAISATQITLLVRGPPLQLHLEPIKTQKPCAPWDQRWAGAHWPLSKGRGEMLQNEEHKTASMHILPIIQREPNWRWNPPIAELHSIEIHSKDKDTRADSLVELSAGHLNWYMWSHRLTTTFVTPLSLAKPQKSESVVKFNCQVEGFRWMSLTHREIVLKTLRYHSPNSLLIYQITFWWSRILLEDQPLI